MSNLFEKNNQRVMNHLKQLNSVSYVASYITFDRDLTMEELHMLNWDYPVKFVWAGIRTEPIEDEYKRISGFRLDNTSVMQINDTPDEDRYPAFNYHEYLREKAVLTLESMPSKYEYYKSALNYVEKNGVNAVGALVFATPQDLINFIENGPVKAFGIDEVLASRRYIY